MPLEAIDLVSRVAAISDQASRLESIDQLFSFEVGAIQQAFDGCAKFAFAFDVSGRAGDAEMLRESLTKLGKVDFLGNHMEYVKRDVVVGNVLGYRCARH